MSSTTDDLTLAAEFAPATYENWRKLVDGVLKGAPFEKLVGKTADGLRIDPIYTRAKGAAPIAGRGAAAPWQIMQRIDHSDAAQANAQALQDLANGANGLTLVFEGSNAARGFGLPPTSEALTRTLDGIYLDAGIAIEFEISPHGRDIGQHFADLLKVRKLSPSDIDVRFGFDPIGGAAVRGGSAGDWATSAKVFGDKIVQLKALGFRGPFAAIDGRVIHDAGGSEAQELVFVLATGVAYLRALEAAGLSLEDARSAIHARLAADADQFLTMAKFRALRLLWAQVEQSCGLAPTPLFIAADTAWRMLTQRDADVNMLRATMAVFSAGLAGANAICVLPHTLALGLPEELARRIARNTQLVLLEESNLAKVSDPAAGAGGIEALTRELCESAWAQFQEIEKAGGVFAALQQNLIQPKVAAVRAARDANIARRKDVLTGASEFPNLHEAMPSVLKTAAQPAAAETQAISFDALAPIRLAAPFEALRDRSDTLLKQSGARPKIWLANLGKPSDFTARATFAKSLFEAGGIEAIDTEGFSDPAALAGAFKASGARLACLCSSDAVYAEHAIAAAKALQAAGAKHIYLAGRPGEKEAEFRAAGVGDFVSAGGNALATLETAYANMVTP
jgi:methylmalonyl-CoA mutase